MSLCGDIHPNPGPSVSNFLNVLHMNVNSITANNKLDEIYSLCIHNNIDVICLNETKLDDSISNDDIMIPGFNAPFRSDRNRHGGGVAIYTRDYLRVRLRNDLRSPD